MKLKTKQHQLIKSFNQPDTYLVVSRWPSKQGVHYDGIASYTKDIVTMLAKLSHQKFVVLAEKTQLDPTIELVNKHILIIRVFDTKKHSIFPVIVKWLWRFSAMDTVYIHSEFCASGGIGQRALVLPFVALIKLMRKSVVFYAHNIVSNLNGLGDHLNVNPGSIKFNLLTFGLNAYYTLLGLLVDRFVVLEETVKNKLKKFVKNTPILVQPHWINIAKPKYSSKKSKQLLGFKAKDKLIVSFGFITPYKGAHNIAKLAVRAIGNNKLKNHTFILAGGNTSYSVASHYQKDYYQNINLQAKNQENLVVTGFLNEKDIGLWFQAADAIVFPYQALMGGSGALQQAIRFSKPILVSQPFYQGHKDWLKPYMNKLGIRKSEVCYGRSVAKLEKFVEKFATSKVWQNKITKLVKLLAKDRDAGVLVTDHYLKVYSDNQPKSLRLDTKKALA